MIDPPPPPPHPLPIPDPATKREEFAKTSSLPWLCLPNLTPIPWGYLFPVTESHFLPFPLYIWQKRELSKGITIYIIMPMRKVNQNSKIIYLNSTNTMNINKDELMKLSKDELINMLGDRKHC